MNFHIHEPINFIKNSTDGEKPKTDEPVEPPFDFSDFQGIGVIDAVDSAGYIDTTNIQSMWIQRALFKQYNDHLIYLLGNQDDLMKNAKTITVTINGDVLPCVIDYQQYLAFSNQTVFGCTTKGYDGLKYSVGQQFNLSFN